MRVSDPQKNLGLKLLLQNITINNTIDDASWKVLPLDAFLATCCLEDDVRQNSGGIPSGPGTTWNSLARAGVVGRSGGKDTSVCCQKVLVLTVAAK